MGLASKIKKMRTEHELTQEQFAQKLNVSRKTVSGWENGRSYPDINTLVEISNSFNLSLDYLLKEDNEVITYYQDELATNKRHKIAEVVVYLALILFLVLTYLSRFFIVKFDGEIIYVSLTLLLFLYLIIYPVKEKIQSTEKLMSPLFLFLFILFINLFFINGFTYHKHNQSYFESVGYMTATFYIDLIISSSLFVLLTCKPTIFKKFKSRKKATK